MRLFIPISPAITLTGVAIGIILSVVGGKNALGGSKIMELAIAVFLLVVITVTSIGGKNDKYVQMVKNGTLEAYPQMEVGEAFDVYLKNPKWESGLSEDNTRFVNVTGEILYYDKEVEIVIQFIVDEKKRIIPI